MWVESWFFCIFRCDLNLVLIRKVRRFDFLGVVIFFNMKSYEFSDIIYLFKNIYCVFFLWVVYDVGIFG